MISCRVNGPNLRPNMRRDTDTKKQEQGFNVAFEIWLMDSTKKTTKWVCENYSTIFLPKFDTQKMISKRQRKINSKTARKMLIWSHYRFKTRLMNKAREYPNCRVIICGEEYTSQSCSKCGYLHRKIGGSKKFKWPGYNQESDRDFNAARNILVKNMSLVFRD
jgi:putative transposase